MQSAIPPQIFSQLRRLAMWARLRTRQRSHDAAQYLLDDAIEEVAERIGFMNLEPRTALIIGDWSGRLAEDLKVKGVKVTQRTVDEIDEQMPFAAAEYDLIIHLLSMATINDLPGALIHLRNALTDTGVFFATFVGAGSLPKLRQIMLHADGDRPAPRIHPMIDSSASSALLQRAGFGRQVVDSHTLSVRFSTFDRMIGDLRDQGQTSVFMTRSPAVGKRGLERAREAFTELADADGKVSETFEILTLTGWKT